MSLRAPSWLRCMPPGESVHDFEDTRSRPMQVRPTRCAGLDVHKKTVVACILLTTPHGQVQRYRDSFSTMTSGLMALDDWLSNHDVSQVALESTGIYWRPVFTILDATRSVMVVTAQHIKAVPGRKTDVKDAEWIA